MLVIELRLLQQLIQLFQRVRLRACPVSIRSGFSGELDRLSDGNLGLLLSFSYPSERLSFGKLLIGTPLCVLLVSLSLYLLGLGHEFCLCCLLPLIHIRKNRSTAADHQNTQ